MTPHQQSLSVRCTNRADAGIHPLTPDAPLHMTHTLGETGLFEDAALEALLDTYPAGDVHVTTMETGTEPLQPVSGWRVGTVRGLSGAQVLRAVSSGRLWLNIKRLDRNAPAYARLLQHIYGELASALGCPAPAWQSATLLVSSPTACVYYHADSIPNVLWQVRGEKQLLLYPGDDARFAPPEYIERICSGESEERLPYQPDFEVAALAFDLVPGQALMWPQNSPHRVTNRRGMNVSLSTEHLTLQARARVNYHRGNRVLRRLGWQSEPRPPQSLAGRLSQLLGIGHAAGRKVLRRGPVSFDLSPTFQVDPDAERGYRDLR